MKKLASIFTILLLLIVIIGCGHSQIQMKKMEVLERALKYEAQKSQNSKPVQQNLVEIEWTDDGQRMKSFKMGNPYETNNNKNKTNQMLIAAIQPDPHPAWRFTKDMTNSILHSPIASYLGIALLADAIGDNSGDRYNDSYNDTASHNQSGESMAVGSGGPAKIDSKSNFNNPVDNSITDSQNDMSDNRENYNNDPINNSINDSQNDMSDNRENYENDPVDNRQDYNNPLDDRENYDNDNRFNYDNTEGSSCGD